MATETELRRHRCCFTGHRTQGLTRPEEAIKEDLEKAIQLAIEDGYTTFITGMAYGVDLIAAEIVLRLQERNPDLHLIAAIPFEGVEQKWRAEWRERYKKVRSKADAIRIINQYPIEDAYKNRNHWMVDHCSRLIAVYNGRPSGTKCTIMYARSQFVPIVYIEA